MAFLAPTFLDDMVSQERSDLAKFGLFQPGDRPCRVTRIASSEIRTFDDLR